MDYNCLPALLILKDYYAVLKIEVDSEGLWVKLDFPELACLQCNFLTLHFLKQIQVPGVKLYSAHLSKNCVEGCFVLSREKEPVLVDVGVELFYHLRLVALEVFLAAH